MYSSPAEKFKELIHPFKRKYHHEFSALKDISFDVKRGECIGIIGRNGSGKSTLLQIICGILQPTGGEIKVNGKISALLELGAGFNPSFTGRENIYINGSLAGFSSEEMDRRFHLIADFADIGKFIDQPVKTYSSGMYVRLAFACSVNVDPDILIVDEALSVGDIFFQQKCHARMEQLLTTGTTIILVSHDMRAIGKYSTKVLLLDKGNCLYWGQPTEAVLRYYALANQSKSEEDSADSSDIDSATDQYQQEDVVISDWPSKDSFIDLSRAVCIGEKERVRCTRLALCSKHGTPKTVFKVGDTAIFFSEYDILKDIRVPVGGIAIINKQNILLHSKCSLHYYVQAPAIVHAGSRVRFRQEIVLNLAPDEYTFLGLFSTMESKYYYKAKDTSHTNLFSHLQGLLSVSGAGSFLIKVGHDLPFYGYTDLPGTCYLKVL
jgi:lipopolysaccharide transport system ATP-binding protein